MTLFNLKKSAMHAESVIHHYVESLIQTSNITVSRAYLENVVRTALFSFSANARLSCAHELYVLACYKDFDVVFDKLSFLRSLVNSQDYEKK